MTHIASTICTENAVYLLVKRRGNDLHARGVHCAQQAQALCAQLLQLSGSRRCRLHACAACQRLRSGQHLDQDLYGRAQPRMHVLPAARSVHEPCGVSRVVPGPGLRCTSGSQQRSRASSRVSSTLLPAVPLDRAVPSAARAAMWPTSHDLWDFLMVLRRSWVAGHASVCLGRHTCLPCWTAAHCAAGPNRHAAHALHLSSYLDMLCPTRT